MIVHSREKGREKEREKVRQLRFVAPSCECRGACYFEDFGDTWSSCRYV